MSQNCLIQMKERLLWDLFKDQILETTILTYIVGKWFAFQKFIFFNFDMVFFLGWIKYF